MSQGMTSTISINGGPEIPFEPEKILDHIEKKFDRKIRKADDAGATAGGIAADRLRSLVDRIERLEEERKALGNDIKDIYIEAKSAGFDVKVLRQIIRLRKQEPAEIEEQENLLDVYRRALGM